jgi:hypothetical protein
MITKLYLKNVIVINQKILIEITKSKNSKLDEILFFIHCIIRKLYKFLR